MKSREEFMEILEAFDLTGSFRDGSSPWGWVSMWRQRRCSKNTAAAQHLEVVGQRPIVVPL